MKHQRNFVLALLSVLLFGDLVLASAQAAEKRIALVVGNANYSSGALPTPANDAGLIAQTLQAAGFDVVGVRDLDQDSLRRTFRDFIAKVSAAGPDTVSFIYLSGYGLQLEGENYFVPTDANIARDANVSSEALRLSDYTKPLAALGIKVSIVVLDGARASPFAKSGPPLASGLALVEPDPGTLIAFNAAPGTVAPDEAGPYSSYAQALAEMMREGGLPVTDMFNRVRLRVNDATKGAQVPWNASKLEAPFYFFERAPDAPPPQVSLRYTPKPGAVAYDFDDPQEMAVKLFIHNTGRTGAVIRRLYGEFSNALPDGDVPVYADVAPIETDLSIAAGVEKTMDPFEFASDIIMPLYFWGYVEYVDIFKNKRTQNRPFGSLPLIPQQRKYKGHRPWSGWGHWRPTQRTAAKSIPIQSRRQQGRAASEAQ